MNKILLNGLHYAPHGAGISRYTENLLSEFLKEDYKIDVLLRKECMKQKEDERLISTKKEIGTSSIKRILEEQWRSKGHYKRYNLVHFPDYATPILYQGKTVATIHDMAMHTMKDKYTFRQNLTKNIILQHTIKYADRLICVSKFSKKELLTYYPQVEEKVRVIYEGITVPIQIEDRTREKNILCELGIREDYLLYVGTIAPHKNITLLIRAFAKVKRLLSNYKLVIAGKKGWMYEEVFQEVIKLGLEKEVIFTDFVEDEVLEALYKHTSCFVSTSLYEGFGFPPLEAMARGCPVVVSDIEVFREVCGQKVLYCNPQDDDHIARVILQVLQHEGLRNQFKKCGIEYVKQYSWGKVANETYNVYRELMEE